MQSASVFNCNFSFLIFIPNLHTIKLQIVGIVAVVLTGIWTGLDTGYYLGGFAWRSNPSLQFNWHPFLMNFGMIYLYGNGMRFDK